MTSGSEQSIEVGVAQRSSNCGLKVLMLKLCGSPVTCRCTKRKVGDRVNLTNLKA